MLFRSGAVARRVVIVPFGKSVPDHQKDMDLPKKLASEIGAIIIKCARAYSESVKDLQGKSIRNIMPAFLTDAISNGCINLSPLQSYLESGLVEFGEGYKCPQSVFNNEFRKFCTSHNMQLNRIDNDYFDAIFEDYNIIVNKNPEPYEMYGEHYTSTCFEGLRLKV